MKITVLGGGDSPEREVSLRSAAAVADALATEGFDVTQLDPADIQVLDSIPGGSIVFPILHGYHGEDGYVQSELDARNLPYLGSGSKASADCFDKWKTRQLLEQLGLAVALGEHVDKASYPASQLKNGPHVLKAVGGGSSIGTYIVRNPGDISESGVKGVFAVSDTAVVEELVEGVEITVPILDGTALPVIEIQPPKEQEFDYENKYNGLTQELCPAVSISGEVQKTAQVLAEKAHAGLGCRHLSRVDMIVRPDSSMVILEINTMPGMTDQSLFPKSAHAAGIPFPALMSRCVDMVRRDYELRTYS